MSGMAHDYGRLLDVKTMSILLTVSMGSLTSLKVPILGSRLWSARRGSWSGCGDGPPVPLPCLLRRASDPRAPSRRCRARPRSVYWHPSPLRALARGQHAKPEVGYGDRGERRPRGTGRHACGRSFCRCAGSIAAPIAGTASQRSAVFRHARCATRTTGNQATGDQPRPALCVAVNDATAPARHRLERADAARDPIPEASFPWRAARAGGISCTKTRSIRSGLRQSRGCDRRAP